MDEEAARAELDRVHEEVGSGRANTFVKLGANAIFNAEDVDRIQIEKLPSS